MYNTLIRWSVANHPHHEIWMIQGSDPHPDPRSGPISGSRSRPRISGFAPFRGVPDLDPFGDLDLDPI